MLFRGVKSLWSFLNVPSLARRSAASAVLGLALALALLATVTLWTVDEITQQEYQERLDLAIAIASHVDLALNADLTALEEGARDLVMPITQEQARGLEAVALKSGRTARVKLIDERGASVWQDPRAPTVPDGVDQDVARRVLSTGRTQITACLDEPSSGSPVLACLGVPVLDTGGAIVGALTEVIDSKDTASGLLPFTDVGGDMRVSLVDASTGSTDLDSAHRSLLADLIAARTPGLRVHPASANADSHITAFAPSTLSADLGVYLEQPRDTALAAPRLLELRLGAVGIILLLVAGAGAWWDVRRVARPLGRLILAAQRFAAGQLDQPVRVQGTDEVGSLASAFETMRQRLRTSLAEVAEWNHELEERVAARTAEVEVRNRELAHLNAIAETVSRTLDVQVMLEQTLSRVMQITTAESGCFQVVQEPATHLVRVAEQNLPPRLLDSASDRADCFCTRAMNYDGVVLLEGAQLEAEASEVRAAGLASCLVVPLQASQQAQGILFLGSSRADQFREVDLRTLAAIGRQVGMALANARLYERLQVRERERAELLQRAIAGQEEERRRLAQELHDETSQALASLQLGLEQLAERSREPEVRLSAAELQRMATDTLADVHRMAVELRPSVLDDVGLVAALQRYVEEIRGRSRLAINFASVGIGAIHLRPAAATVVYRVVQSAVTNALQHAQAQEISILVQRRGEDLVVVVEDDGRGFDLPSVRAAPLEQRLGLAGMDERAAFVRATLTVETEPGAGTSVFLKVPLAANTVEEEDRQHASAGTR